MGRKRRKIIRKQAKPFPKVFICPLCNALAVTVTLESRNIAVVKCGNCGVSHEVPWYRSYMPVDAYSAWYDVVTGRRSVEDLKREIERMTITVEEAEASAEEAEAQPQETVETADEEVEETSRSPEE
jgi:transcription elongation factor Elf1